MRAKMLWGGVCLLLGLSGPPARAQSRGATLEERLAVLERRVEQPEKENIELKIQVARILPHSARAFAGKFYRTREETHQLRLGFEYDLATGDRDPKDGRSGEFHNLFPTDQQLYGYADLMGWRNMRDFRPMFTVTPAPAGKFDIDYHRFYLLAARGPWKNASGAVLGFDPTGESGTQGGDELDFTLAFPLQKHFKILSGYSLFVPGEFARKTRGEDDQHFVNLQTLVDF
jgi:hypothetical protein